MSTNSDRTEWNPRDYQSAAGRYLRNNSAVLIAGVGAGKTVTALSTAAAMMRRGDVRRCLILAPKLVATTVWPAELAKWAHLKGRTMTVAVGDPAAREAAVRSNSDFLVINYDNIPWLVSLLQQRLPGTLFDLIIVDEITKFKGTDSILRKDFLTRLRPRAKYCWGLTASPLTEDDYQALWGPMVAVDFGLTLGDTLTTFRKRYMLKGERGPWDWQLQEDGAERIEADLRKGRKMRRVPAEAVMPYLPERTDVTVPVPLPPPLLREHARLKKHLLAVLDGGRVSITAPNAAAALGKCLQLTSGAVYPDTPKNGRAHAPGDARPIHRLKLGALDAVLTEHGPMPTLIAYAYRHELHRLRKRWPGLREAREPGAIADWQAGRIDRLALHPASAGEGLNLQRPEAVALVWVTLPYSWRLVSQTEGRLVRQGQHHPVRVVRLVCPGTVDEAVVALHERKSEAELQFIQALLSVT